MKGIKILVYDPLIQNNYIAYLQEFLIEIGIIIQVFAYLNQLSYIYEVFSCKN